MDLLDEIKNLISMHQEGSYWDFKREWYGKYDKKDLLLDIICMANNLVNRDAYIIIGVDEENEYSIKSVEGDANRRNTQNLTDFIRSKKFAGDYKPVVTVESFSLSDGKIDVIVVHNSMNTPFYLKEQDGGVNANNIYVRLQDSNTPISGAADYYQVELLWKKRFGMLLTPMEKVKQYLLHPEDWESSPAMEDMKYYKYAPEYTIVHNTDIDNSRDGYEYYLFAQTDSNPRWSEIRVMFHQTVLADLGGVILDGGRYFTATPCMDGFNISGHLSWDVSYKYMVKGEINHLVHEFYYQNHNDEERIAHDKFEECILIFENEDEHLLFNKYAVREWSNHEAYAKDIWIPHMGQIAGYNMDAFREQYRNVQILRRMLEAYRSEQTNTK